MGRLTNHFTLAELTATASGLPNEPNGAALSNLMRLAQVLELCRFALGACGIRVTSGYRSPAVNAKVGGARTSAHLDGRAADFIPMGNAWKLDDAFDRLRADKDIPFDQLILEPGWIHIGLARVREKPRRQALVARKTKDGMAYDVAGAL